MNLHRDLSSRTGPACLVALLLSATVLAVDPLAVDPRSAGPQRPTPEATNDATEETREASEALRRVMGTPETAVPPSVLARATAVGVFGNVVQAAFIAGGRGGDGVVSARRGNGAWSVPAFFRMGGASVGAQIGARRTDIVLIFTTQKALDSLLDDRLEFGAEVKAVAGPNGREAQGAAATADSGLLIYSRDRGLFAGAALDGAVITPNNDLNGAIYGLGAREILTGSVPSRSTDVVQPFMETLTRYLPPRS